jgi:putative ABC transport system permease protein
MNALTRGMRNAFRNGIRTVSIIFILALSIGLSLTMLVARQAVEQKIADVKSSIGNTITITPAGAKGFEGGGEPLTTTQMSQVKKLAHVTSVTSTLSDRLSTDNTNLQSSIDAGSLGRRFQSADGGTSAFSQKLANFTPPITITGIDSLSNTQVFGKTLKLTSGKAITPSGSANEAMIGSALATKNNLQVGSTFTAYGQTITVVGIYDTGNKFENGGVVVPLASLQTLAAESANVTSATVQADSITNVDAVVSSIKSTVGADKADVTSQQDQSNEALAPLENIKSISLISLIGAATAGAVIILLTMVMIVRERRREIGVLKAVGGSNFTVMSQFVSEALTFTIIASVIGLLIGVAGAAPVTQTLVSSNASPGIDGAPQLQANGGPAKRIVNVGGGRGFGAAFGQNSAVKNISNVTAAVHWDIVLYAFAGAILIALVGSTVAAFLISKIRPAVVLRSE